MTFSEWVEDPAEDAPRRRGKPGFRSEVPQRGLPAAGAAVSKENEGRCCSGVDWTWRSGCERIFVAARRGGIPSLRSSRTTGSASTTVKDAPTPLPDARTDALARIWRDALRYAQEPYDLSGGTQDNRRDFHALGGENRA